MMNCPCTPDLDLDEIGQVHQGSFQKSRYEFMVSKFADTDSCLLATGRVQRGLSRSKVAQILDGTQRCCACGTDGIAEANGGATMAPCTPGTPTPLTPPIFQAKLFADPPNY